ncbi:hypothetical protein BJ742DRAFT_912891 [Cladochytrium replicatum]|nr:hypothetical protein BJ742DRAFT_912891 [Cladochytrium replicatum]
MGRLAYSVCSATNSSPHVHSFRIASHRRLRHESMRSTTLKIAPFRLETPHRVSALYSQQPPTTPTSMQIPSLGAVWLMRMWSRSGTRTRVLVFGFMMGAGLLAALNTILLQYQLGQMIVDHGEQTQADLWSPKGKSIHLIVEWYWDKNPTRMLELVLVLARNLRNPYIHQIHFVQHRTAFDPGSTYFEKLVGPDGFEVNDSRFNFVVLNALLPSRKLLSVDPNFPVATLRAKGRVYISTMFEKEDGKIQEGERLKRLLASEAFAYASTYLRGHIAILTNLDIYFDDTLRLLHDSDLDYKSPYFLSRFETRPGIDIYLNRNESQDTPFNINAPRPSSTPSLWPDPSDPKPTVHRSPHPATSKDACFIHQFMGSTDSIIFIPPLPRSLWSKSRVGTAIELGSWGIENRLLHEFERQGLTSRNPCLSIYSWHVHSNGYKTEWMPQVNTGGKSSVAFPDTLVSRFKSGYPWDWKRET